jgi:hypothetical protein
MGIARVRPLSGGYAEWKRLGYPLQDPAGDLGAGSGGTIRLGVAGTQP